MKSFLLTVTCLAGVLLSSYAQSSCASYIYYQQEIAKDPALFNRLQQAEELISRFLKSDQQITLHGAMPASQPIIRIPVVVHIVYRVEEENISDQQVRSQIEVLNKEFRRLHADTTKIPSQFKSIAADCAIEFVLAKINPRGYATTGITRKKTSAYSFGLNDKIKFSTEGGDDGWDSDQYLNIWVANLQIGIAGYSSILGGPKNKDGIVVRTTAFGNTGKLSAPYLKGRTAIHELGHWLGLRHIWGDQYCGNDGVEDTPPQGIATRGCPTGVVSSCNNAPTGNMYTNYMDLTDDACMNMFTLGQRDKMRAAFAVGAPHSTLLRSNGATGIPLPGPDPGEVVPRKSVSIYPNPTARIVFVDIHTSKELLGTSITIHNQLGQLLYQTRITKSITDINVQFLKEGIYFLRTEKQARPTKLLITNRATNP